MSSFINHNLLTIGPWQALERSIARYMEHSGYDDVRMVGQTGDHGADILGSKNGKRWVVQVKFRSSPTIDDSSVTEVINAMITYDGNVPVVATNSSAGASLKKRQDSSMAAGYPLQIWDKDYLKRMMDNLPGVSLRLKGPRPYQEAPIENIVNNLAKSDVKSGVVIMATGLGKTFVAGESIRRLLADNTISKILLLVHTNPLLYQLEKSFWPFLTKQQSTGVWNGYEKTNLDDATIVFASVVSVSDAIDNNRVLVDDFDVVIIDEAHHAGSATYKKVIDYYQAGKPNGIYLLGMTATPWRGDENDVSDIFQTELCKIDLVQGMNEGYLSNVDYRLHVDNIDWKKFSEINNLSPRELNKTIFIQEWDDSVVDIIQQNWTNIYRPRCIVFCRTIEHAMRMTDAVNARGFTRAEAIYSGSFNRKSMNSVERSKLLSDFSDGKIGLMCAVDIFNEGLDVPDVNLLVFQRVTHSRRIFVQQLGRGLRVSDDKEKVIVLDFVSDVRRIAAVSEIKSRLNRDKRFYEMGEPVKFVNKSGEVPGAEKFLKIWLEDVATIEDAKDDDHVLKFPPDLNDFSVEGYNA